MEQTRLQKIIEQKADQIRCAIEQAIDEGAKVQKNYVNCATIDEIFLQKDDRNERFAIVLHFESEKIAKLLEPSKECLEKLAEQKRRELEEIEKQIKEKEEKDEPDRN